MNKKKKKNKARLTQQTTREKRANGSGEHKFSSLLPSSLSLLRVSKKKKKITKVRRVDVERTGIIRTIRTAIQFKHSTSSNIPSTRTNTKRLHELGHDGGVASLLLLLLLWLFFFEKTLHLKKNKCKQKNHHQALLLGKATLWCFIMHLPLEKAIRKKNPLPEEGARVGGIQKWINEKKKQYHKSLQIRADKHIYSIYKRNSPYIYKRIGDEPSIAAFLFLSKFQLFGFCWFRKYIVNIIRCVHTHCSDRFKFSKLGGRGGGRLLNSPLWGFLRTANNINLQTKGVFNFFFQAFNSHNNKTQMHARTHNSRKNHEASAL